MSQGFFLTDIKSTMSEVKYFKEFIIGKCPALFIALHLWLYAACNSDVLVWVETIEMLDAIMHDASEPFLFIWSYFGLIAHAINDVI